MADFEIWAAAGETALWPAGTVHRGQTAGAAIEYIIDADPVAACVREIMAERSSWTGSAAELCRAGRRCCKSRWRTRHKGTVYSSLPCDQVRVCPN